MSKFNNGYKYLLCAIYLFSKYAWVIPLRDKKGTSTVKAFQRIISQGRKPNKIWVDQGGELYNKSIVNKIKNTVPWTYSISDLNNKKILGSFYEEELQKTFKNKTNT